MSDLVQRLREGGSGVCPEAADEIVRLNRLLDWCAELLPAQYATGLTFSRDRSAEVDCEPVVASDVTLECKACGGTGWVMDLNPFVSVDRECTACRGVGQTMTDVQHIKARHALGLDTQRVSTRNRYLAPECDTDWPAMVAAGLADVTGGTNHGVWYAMTRKGAEAVLGAGERLCDEDFPAAVEANANA